jgi:hypothetical protein
VSKLIKNNISSRQAFVTMCFDINYNNYYNDVIITAIENCGFVPIRIDNKDHNEKIDDEIIIEIRKSKFLVADLNKHRGWVYYEIGYAHALGIPVFLTCNKFDRKDIHFDLRQYNFIFWTDDKFDDIRERLTKRIISVLKID